jgi:S-(hydroxymethyl)glutathione dehydrogenase/alcohol dehydrogenase
MQAALFYAPHSPMQIEAIDIAEPLGREVLVRTAASGVRHSDLHAIDRGTAAPPQPIVLGHEAAGIVVAVGPHVTEFQPGDHVIACLSFFCGKCDYCLVGRTNLCSDKRTAGRTRRPG